MSEQSDRIKHAIRERRGMYLSELTPEALSDAECMFTVAPLPDDYDSRLRYLGDLLAQMALNHKVADAKLKLHLCSIAAAFSYLLNSSSYRDGELHGFDADELARKLRPVATRSNNQEEA
jgi:hypothetical protein